MKTLYAEIDSLQNEINGTRPSDTQILQQIKEYYRIGLTYTSNALDKVYPLGYYGVLWNMN